jgi:hypothetical protein
MEAKNNDCPHIDTKIPAKLNIHCNGADIYLPDTSNSILFSFTDGTGDPIEVSRIGMKELFTILKARTDRMLHNFDLADKKDKDNAS